jgi:hypothetical protein
VKIINDTVDDFLSFPGQYGFSRVVVVQIRIQNFPPHMEIKAFDDRGERQTSCKKL